MINCAYNCMYEFTCEFYIQYVICNKNVLLTIGKMHEKFNLQPRLFIAHFSTVFTKWISNVSKVKFSRYRPGVAQRVGRGIALLFHDRGTRRGWVVSSTPRPHFTPGTDPVPIFQETGWAPGPVWTGGKSRPYRDSIPDCPTRSQPLYRLRYPGISNVCLHKWDSGSTVVKELCYKSEGR